MRISTRSLVEKMKVNEVGDSWCIIKFNINTADTRFEMTRKIEGTVSPKKLEGYTRGGTDQQNHTL